jgi:hypothetical protein
MSFWGLQSQFAHGSEKNPHFLAGKQTPNVLPVDFDMTPTSFFQSVKLTTPLFLVPRSRKLEPYRHSPIGIYGKLFI